MLESFMLQCPSVSYRHILFSINLAVSRTYTRSPNGFPMDAQWTPNGRPNGRPMDAYEKWGFGDDGLEKGMCVECAYLFFKCTITKSPFFTGVHWASIGASIGRPLGVQYRCPQVLYPGPMGPRKKLWGPWALGPGMSMRDKDTRNTAGRKGPEKEGPRKRRGLLCTICI